MATIAEAVSAAAHCLRNGRPADARVICQRVIEVDANNADALHLWGVAARQEGRGEEAIALMSRAVAIRPDFVPARLNLANALRFAGRHDAARRLYRSATALAPDMAAGWRSQGEYLLREGGSAAREETIRCLTRAVALDPRDADAHLDLGLTLRAAEQAEPAIAAMIRAIQTRPDHMVAWMNLGTALTESGEYAAASIAGRRAVALAPHLAEMYFNSGNAGHAAGDLEEALQAFRRAVLLGLDGAGVRAAMILHDLGRFAEAETDYRRALTGADPTTAIEQLSRLYVDAGRIDDGRLLFATLLREHPLGQSRRGELLTALADLELQTGGTATAAALLNLVQGDGGRLFTLKSIAAFRRTLDGLGMRLARPVNADPDRPAVTSLTLASLGRFAHNALEYVLVRLYAEKHGFTLETPEWVGGYYFDLNDPPPSRPYRPRYYPRLLLNRHLTGAAAAPPPHGVDFRSPLFLLEHKEIYRDRVRSWLKPRAVWSPFLDPALARLAEMGDTLVAVHIRRGDFVQFNYPITETAWYVDWLRRLWPTLRRPVLYVASDDLPAVRRDFAEFSPATRGDVAPDWPNLEFLQDFHVLMHADVVGISTASGFSLLAAQLNQRASLFVAPDRAAGRVQPFQPWTP